MISPPIERVCPQEILIQCFCHVSLFYWPKLTSLLLCCCLCCMLPFVFLFFLLLFVLFPLYSSGFSSLFPPWFCFFCVLGCSSLFLPLAPLLRRRQKLLFGQPLLCHRLQPCVWKVNTRCKVKIINRSPL